MQEARQSGVGARPSSTPPKSVRGPVTKLSPRSPQDEGDEELTPAPLPPRGPSAAKTVILIRHAESEENVAIERSMKALGRLSKGRFPSMEQLIGIQNVVFRSHANCALSKLGCEQANDVRLILANQRFWDTLGDYYIACSPLKRARQTLELIHPNISRVLDRVRLLDTLREATAYESTVNPSELDTRIAEFETWLLCCPAPTVVVVGHSLFFMRMLSKNGVLRNADVMRVTLSPGGRGRCKWTDASLLFRTSLASRHSSYGDMFP